MTTDQKLRYIESFRKLLVSTDTYQAALSHSTFLRGILAAWNADASISLEDFKKLYDEVEIIMDVKRKLPHEGVFV